VKDQDEQDLEERLDEDLYNELRWTLCSAATWATCDDARVPHIKVYAADSCFMHARTLHEFFYTRKRGYLNADDYSTNHVSIVWPKRYEQGINSRLMHLVRNRPDQPPIKDEVTEVAKLILKIWDEFWTGENLDKRFVRFAAKARSKAVKEANTIALGSGLQF